MDPEKQRAISSVGGKAAHEKGTAHQFTSEEAQIAGRKGGKKGGKTTSQNRDHMAKIGRNGALARNSKKGFASMDPEKRREIASQGGKAAHVSGKAHQFTSEEAKIAGRKGGSAPRKTKKEA